MELLLLLLLLYVLLYLFLLLFNDKNILFLRLKQLPPEGG